MVHELRHEYFNNAGDVYVHVCMCMCMCVNEQLIHTFPKTNSPTACSQLTPRLWKQLAHRGGFHLGKERATVNAAEMRQVSQEIQLVRHNRETGNLWCDCLNKLKSCYLSLLLLLLLLLLGGGVIVVVVVVVVCLLLFIIVALFFFSTAYLHQVQPTGRLQIARCDQIFHLLAYVRSSRQNLWLFFFGKREE